MRKLVNWAARGLAFGWAGVLAFVLVQPRWPVNGAVQAAAYGVAGVVLVAWAWADLRPVVAGRRERVPGALLGVLAVTLAGVLAAEVGGLVFGNSYGGLAGFPVILLAGLVIGTNRGSYRVQAEQAAALLAQREELQAEQRRAGLLDERARIAREIHDVLAHSLGALGIQIQAARAVLTDRGDAAGAEELLAGLPGIEVAGAAAGGLTVFDPKVHATLLAAAAPAVPPPGLPRPRRRTGWPSARRKYSPSSPAG